MSATDERGERGGDLVPTWKLERYVLGELPPEELARLRERVEVDVDLRRQVEALQASDAEILRAFPAGWVARQVRSRAEGANGHHDPVTSWWRAVSRFPAVPLAAAALLAVAVVPILQDSPVKESTGARSIVEGVRIKGAGARLFVHRKTPTGSERLDDGAGARAGDLIRLQYDAAAARYGVILSVDGRGTVTRHLPERGAAAAALELGGAVSLASSYELDDAPRWERFYLISSPQPFALPAVLTAAQAAAQAVASGGGAPDSLAVAAGLDQVAVTLAKPGGDR
jgi:hypothetical protein